MVVQEYFGKLLSYVDLSNFSVCNMRFITEQQNGLKHFLL